MKKLLLISFAAICSCSNPSLEKDKEILLLKNTIDSTSINKRYFHVSVYWLNESTGDGGNADFSFGTDGKFPSEKNIKTYADSIFKSKSGYVIDNIFEFKTEQDYKDFNSK